MNCKNCGTLNNQGAKFCVKCGQMLENNFQTSNTFSQQASTIQNVNPQPINNTQIQNSNNIQYNSNQNINPNIQMNNNENSKISLMSYIFIMLSFILKPFTAFKEELNKFKNFKNSAFMSLIVSGIGTLINLITTMFNSVMVKSYDWSSGGYKTTWTWENLKEIEYLKVIGKNFLIYLGIIIAIAVVYYIASLIVKKQPNFSRLLGISAIAVVPMLVCSLVLSPLLSLIWAELAMPITLIGAVYTVILIYEGMNNEILVEGNTKYYFNLICLSILGIAAYYLYMKLFMSSITDGFEDILDLFK